MNRTLLAGLVSAVSVFGAGVTVRFDPSVPETGPFPTDVLTRLDGEQKTGRLVALPLPDCTAEPDTCKEYNLLNTLDGFSVLPRFRVRFSARINPDTLRQGIFFVALENLTDEETGLHKTGDVSPINQVIYDPPTNTVYGKPDQFLDQHRRYLLVATDTLKDTAGDALEADPAFTACRGGGDDYCNALAQAVNSHAGKFAPARVIAASIFTTQSSTAWLENARRAIQGYPVEVRRLGTSNVIDVSNVREFTLRGQTEISPPVFREFNGPFRPRGTALRLAMLGMRVPYFPGPDGIIPPAPTGRPLPLPSRNEDVQFHAFLPTTPAPPSGYPVVLVCHGIGENRFTIASSLAPVFAAAGFATISMTAPGHGFGPLSTVVIKRNDGSAVEIAAPGRGRDTNGDNTIDAFEGGLLNGIINTREVARQAVVEYMVLVKALRAGVDADGDGKPDFDGNRVFNLSHSFGVTYGTILNAVEPNIRAGVLIGGAGSIVDAAAIALPFQPLTAFAFLLGRVPNLINGPGIVYNQNHVFRDLPVRVNNVPGAIELQNFFERSEWFQNNGDALGYATHLWRSPLPGVPQKPILNVWHLKDVTMPNPMTLQLIRAYGQPGFDRVYRHDIARGMIFILPADPHRFAFIEGPFIPAMAGIAQGLQEMVAGFFASNGTSIPDGIANARMRPFFGGQDLVQSPSGTPESVYFKLPVPGFPEADQ